MYLYKNKVTIKEANDARFFSGGLEAYIKQRPNKRFLGTIRIGLYLYKAGSKNDKWLSRTLRYKLGEAPVILDSALIETSVKGMRTYLRTKGYYYPGITYTVDGEIHKGRVIYKVSLNKAYHISHVYYHIADGHIDSLIRSKRDESFIRNGNQLKQENLLKEQTRLSDLLRNHGYYTFNKDLIKFDMDTAEGNYYASVGININNEENFETYKTYKVNKVTIEIDKQGTDNSEKIKDTFNLRRFVYIPHHFPLNPDVLDRTLFIDTNTLFRQDRSTATFNRLNDLQIFKTVNISAVTYNEKTDSAELNFQIKLTPSKKYDLIFEPQAITTDQANLAGYSTLRNYGLASQVTLSNKNIFHNAEILQLRYRASIEAQRGANIPTRPFFNSFENSLSASLTFPRLIFFERIDRLLYKFTNKSVISASSIYERNVDWIRNVYTVGFSYQFNRKKTKFSYSPLEISYIKTDFNNENLAQQSKNDPYLQSVFNNNLITDMRFGVIFNNQTELKRKDFFYFRCDLEFAGFLLNKAYDVLNVKANDSGYRSFLGVKYFQYVKTYAEVRFNKYIDDNNRIATRFAIGVANPYGNTPDYIPFDKRFFTGGANSIRAFLPRSIGPGSYNHSGQLDRSGDVKLETNIEFRFNLYNHFLEGALFGDVGNIWRIKEDGRDEAAFKFNSFYKQLGVGTGAGLRLNLDFLIFRVDASFPIFDPRKPIGQRYVFKSYSDLGVLWGYTIFNFGVGYPF